jgi:chemosensory pili system protein ChpA (sensor histidine kinase/response regulator)
VCKILVIDDATIIREPLARLLKTEGFEIFCAADGSEAMAQLHYHGADLILLDILMPHMHGIAFLEALRSDERFKSIPVIALTGLTDTSRLTRLRELGVSTIVHKVRFTFDGLLAQIREYLPEQTASPV